MPFRNVRNARFPCLLLAALLPIVAMSSAVILYVTHQARENLRYELGSTAGHAAKLIDQAIESDLAVLEALAASQSLDNGDIAQFRELAQRIQATKPAWRNVILTTPAQQNILSLLRAPETAPLPVVDKDTVDAVLRSRERVVGGISPPGNVFHLRLIPIRVPVMRNGELRYVLTAILYPEGIAEIIQKVVPDDWLATVVDQNGRVVSRAQDGEKYVGTKASEGASEAVAKFGSSGIYKTKARTGENVTVIYRTSAVTGWTVHFAVPDTAFDLGVDRSVVFAVMGGLISIALGAMLMRLIYRDVAIQRRKDESLRQAQKMEALGQLTSGVVHDFSNVLQVIHGSIEILLITAREDSVKKTLALALVASERGKSVLERLKVLIRQEVTDAAPVFLADHLVSAKDLLDALLVEKISTSVRAPVDIWPIKVDVHELDIALMNAATNARDAMPNGGDFEIVAANVTLADDSNELVPHLRGDFVQLTLRDTGEGMSTETRRQAFEPFFSTKPKDKGTGLGLSQIYGFAVQSGGAAAIESDRGRGTSIHLFFPRYSSDGGAG